MSVNHLRKHSQQPIQMIEMASFNDAAMLSSGWLRAARPMSVVNATGKPLTAAGGVFNAQLMITLLLLHALASAHFSPVLSRSAFVSSQRAERAYERPSPVQRCSDN